PPLAAWARPADLRRAGALVGEGDQHQAVDALRLRLRIGAGADRAGRRAVEVHLDLAGLLHHDRDRGFQVLDAARDIGIVAGAAGTAVAVVVHGPHVEAETRHDVHERVLALAGHREVVGRARRVRGAVYEEQHRQRTLAVLRYSHALAPEVEPDIAFAGPVFRTPGRLRRLGGGGCGHLGKRRRDAGGEARPDTKAGRLEHTPPRHRMILG